MTYRALRSLSILSLVLLIQSCADMPFAPNIEPPFWDAHGRSVRLEVYAAGPPGFDGYGDPQTFGTFRVDTEAEAALRCAAARTIDVSPSIRKLAELARTRGLAVDPEIVRSRPFSGASFTDASNVAWLAAPPADPASDYYVLAATVSWWGVAREYFLFARRPLHAEVDLELMLYAAASGKSLYSARIAGTSPISTRTGISCDEVAAAVQEAQDAATRGALREFSHWSGRHPLRVYSAPGRHRTGMGLSSP